VWNAARFLWRHAEARHCLFGQALVYGFFAGYVVILVQEALRGDDSQDELLSIAAWLLGGLTLGSFLAGCKRHPRRMLGLVSLGATGLAVEMILIALGIAPSPLLNLVLGAMGGLIIVPLSATFQANLSTTVRGSGTALGNVAKAASIALMTAFVLSEVVLPEQLFWVLAGLAVLVAFWSWWTFFRETLELLLEILLFPMYHIRARGPGMAVFPSSGPLIVIANHSAWFDPVWLAKALPRRLIPMMTSVFYDLPVMRWLMVHVAHAIRVQASTFRREVPELREAIAVLDRGECLVIFPEGAMRKSAEQLLRPFGQGVWHILRERPQTPVVVCWIEGGWGSYFSYCHGSPTKNKRFDFRRRIEIAVNPPRILPPDLLENQKATRSYLMQACLEARTILGLEVPSLTAMDNKKEEEAASPDPES
jgi:1-acyl-sn-glycerol-3-phosphate acyltransferase